MQYTGSSWQEKEAKLYKNGAWLDIIQYIIHDGVANEITKPDPIINNTGESVSNNVSYSTTGGKLKVTLKGSSNPENGLIGLGKYDLTNISKITFDYTFYTGDGNWQTVAVRIQSILNDTRNIILEKFRDTGSEGTESGTHSFDTSSLTGEYYITVFVYMNSGTVPYVLIGDMIME